MYIVCFIISGICFKDVFITAKQNENFNKVYTSLKQFPLIKRLIINVVFYLSKFSITRAPLLLFLVIQNPWGMYNFVHTNCICLQQFLKMVMCNNGTWEDPIVIFSILPHTAAQYSLAIGILNLSGSLLHLGIKQLKYFFFNFCRFFSKYHYSYTHIHVCIFGILQVWDLSAKPSCDYTIHTIASVGRIKWRPQKKYHIASCALVVDCSINVWDIRRPYIPFASFNEHKDIPTGVAWRGSPQSFLSTSRVILLIIFFSFFFTVNMQLFHSRVITVRTGLHIVPPCIRRRHQAGQ